MSEIKERKPNGYWTFDKCKEEALKYNIKELFKNSAGAYNAARRNNWMVEICSHMINNRIKIQPQPSCQGI
jgi:hypothetical protein